MIDNNEGITVIDVTDPMAISLCFVFLRRMKPVTAEGYMRAFCASEDGQGSSFRNPCSSLLTFPADPPSSADADAVTSLSHLKTITLDTLEETWPDEYSTSEGYVSGPYESLDQVEIAHSEPAPAPSLEPVVPTLVDLALGRALEQCLESGEGMEHLEYALDLPGKAAIIFDSLKAMAAFSDHSLGFLQKLLKRTAGYPNHINLSGYRLTGGQVASVLESPQQIKGLDISHNPKMSKDELLQLLPLLPNLAYLNLLATPLSTSEVSFVLEMKPRMLPKVQALIHLLFTHKKNPLKQTIGFHINGESVVMPLLSLDSAVRMIWNLMALVLMPKNRPRGLFSYMVQSPNMAMVTACFRFGHEAWDDRMVPFIARGPVATGREGLHFNLYFNYKEKTYGIITKKQKTNSDSDSNEEKEEEEVITFSAFLSRLESEGFSPASDLARVQNLTDISKAMTLVSIAGYLEELQLQLWSDQRPWLL
jgi:hypothetical protein